MADLVQEALHLDHERMVRETVGHWYPRFLAAGVDYNDAQRILAAVTHWDDWCQAWCAAGERHERHAAEQARLGRRLTAGEAFHRAAMCYHFGQFMWFHRPDEKRAAANRKVAAYMQGAPLLSPPAQRLEIPMGALSLPGYLRRSPVGGAGRQPVILMLPGADSSKEQLRAYEELFLARGLATLSVDGPGQGETRYRCTLPPDYEKAVIAIVDFVITRPDLDSERIALLGTSFGGYLALRGAAFEHRLRAVVDAAGFYDLSYWDELSPLLKTNFSFLFGQESWEAGKRFAAQVSLAGLVREIRCPVLVIHGAQDKIVPVTDAYRIRDEAPNRVELVVYPEGNHVCNNLSYLYRPLTADWVAEQLGRSTPPPSGWCSR